MLKIINNLSPFFEDCYRRISVREYAKIAEISPPTASKLLIDYWKEGLLEKEEYKNYRFFYASKENKIFTDLSKIYWSIKMKELVNFLNKELINPVIILFGSLAKAETKIDSDMDIAIFSRKRDINLKNFRKILKRDIQLFWFNYIKDIKNKELANNIINGYILNGRLKI